MRKCPECATLLPDKARFCHECGLKVAQDVVCKNCDEINPPGAKFCRNCGESQIPGLAEKNSTRERTAESPPRFETPPRNTESKSTLFDDRPVADLEEEIRADFAAHLEAKIKDEQDPILVKKYFERLENSDFKYSFDVKMRQLAEDTLQARESSDYNATREAVEIHRVFDRLSDFFFVFYCTDLNVVELSERILRWQHADEEAVDLLQMTEDYLDLENESGVTYYTNFVTMPLDRLRNAGKSFLFPEPNEKILLICDQSVLGSLKEGFALTEKAFYWRMHFEKPRKVLFTNLEEIRTEKDWITINGHFFNSHKSLNVKILKLLKKMREAAGQG